MTLAAVEVVSSFVTLSGLSEVSLEVQGAVQSAIADFVDVGVEQVIVKGVMPASSPGERRLQTSGVSVDSWEMQFDVVFDFTGSALSPAAGASSPSPSAAQCMAKLQVLSQDPSTFVQQLHAKLVESGMEPRATFNAALAESYQYAKVVPQRSPGPCGLCVTDALPTVKDPCRNETGQCSREVRCVDAGNTSKLLPEDMCVFLQLPNLATSLPCSIAPIARDSSECARGTPFDSELPEADSQEGQDAKSSMASAVIVMLCIAAAMLACLPLFCGMGLYKRLKRSHGRSGNLNQMDLSPEVSV